MASWNDLLDRARTIGGGFDVIRREALQEFSRLTDRNVIVYYSGWLTKPGYPALGAINDLDISSFMSAIVNLDRTKGLDLIIHSPGGDVAATESLIDYLRIMFPSNIRAIVPQLAMSGGTMLACATEEIIMGKHSSLGPVDPQYGGISASGIIEEFNRASKEIKKDPKNAYVWQPILSKYQPTLVGECVKGIQWSQDLLKRYLTSGMLRTDSPAVRKRKLKKILDEFTDHDKSLAHNRHLSSTKALEVGLKISSLEEMYPDDKKKSQDFQNGVLHIHHSCLLTLEFTAAIKITENQNGVAVIRAVPQQK